MRRPIDYVLIRAGPRRLQTYIAYTALLKHHLESGATDSFTGLNIHKNAGNLKVETRPQRPRGIVRLQAIKTSSGMEG